MESNENKPIENEKDKKAENTENKHDSDKPKPSIIMLIISFIWMAFLFAHIVVPTYNMPIRISAEFSIPIIFIVAIVVFGLSCTKKNCAWIGITVFLLIVGNILSSITTNFAIINNPFTSQKFAAYIYCNILGKGTITYYRKFEPIL